MAYCMHMSHLHMQHANARTCDMKCMLHVCGMQLRLACMQPAYCTRDEQM